MVALFSGPLHRRGPHARHRVLLILEPRTRGRHVAGVDRRHEPRPLNHSWHGVRLAARNAHRLFGSAAHYFDVQVRAEGA